MGGSHETPFKMKGSGHYGLGNSSPAKNAPGPPDHKHPHPKQTDEQFIASAKKQKSDTLANLAKKAEQSGLSGPAAKKAAAAEYERNL